MYKLKNWTGDRDWEISKDRKIAISSKMKRALLHFPFYYKQSTPSNYQSYYLWLEEMLHIDSKQHINDLRYAGCKAKTSWNILAMSYSLRII